MPLPAAFTPYTLAKLTSEVQNDPLNLGYAAAKTSGGDQAIANLMNSLTSAGAGPIYVNNLPAVAIRQAVVPADLLSLTSLQLQQLSFLLESGVFDCSNANVQTAFGTLFASKPNTITAFTAIAVVTGSRAQVLWGMVVGTITASQINQAIGS